MLENWKQHNLLGDQSNWHNYAHTDSPQQSCNCCTVRLTDRRNAPTWSSRSITLCFLYKVCTTSKCILALASRWAGTRSFSCGGPFLRLQWRWIHAAGTGTCQETNIKLRWKFQMWSSLMQPYACLTGSAWISACISHDRSTATMSPNITWNAFTTIRTGFSSSERNSPLTPILNLVMLHQELTWEKRCAGGEHFSAKLPLAGFAAGLLGGGDNFLIREIAAAATHIQLSKGTLAGPVQSSVFYTLADRGLGQVGFNHLA